MLVTYTAVVENSETTTQKVDDNPKVDVKTEHNDTEDNQKNERKQNPKVDHKEEQIENVSDKENNEIKSTTAKPIEKKLSTISIGKQLWMKENLKLDTFQNNDEIFHAKTEKEWILAGENKIPAWCYPNNDSNLGDEIGKLYNWYAASDPRGLCPLGMRVPKREDIDELISYLHSNNQNTKSLKSKHNWKRKGNGDDFYKMNIIPYPKRYAMGTFTPDGYACAFWSQDENIHYTSYFWELRAENDDITLGKVDKNAGFLIRCIKI